MSSSRKRQRNCNSSDESDDGRQSSRSRSADRAGIQSPSLDKIVKKVIHTLKSAGLVGGHDRFDRGSSQSRDDSRSRRKESRRDRRSRSRDRDSYRRKSRSRSRSRDRDYGRKGRKSEPAPKPVQGTGYIARHGKTYRKAAPKTRPLLVVQATNHRKIASDRVIAWLGAHGYTPENKPPSPWKDAPKAFTDLVNRLEAAKYFQNAVKRISKDDNLVEATKRVPNVNKWRDAMAEIGRSDGAFHSFRSTTGGIGMAPFLAAGPLRSRAAEDAEAVPASKEGEE